MDVITAREYFEQQQKLEREAAKAYSYDFSDCTHHLSVQRQQLYACLTCLNTTSRPLALCYSCTIQCHMSHEIVSLGSRRKLTCDCGTVRGDGSRCELRQIPELESSDNREEDYNHNFNGDFCICNSHHTDEITSPMLQCLLGSVCTEDWYHADCILGGSYPLARDSPVAQAADTTEEEVGDSSGEGEMSEDENAEVTYPPGFPSQFEAFICWRCAEIEKIEYLANTEVCSGTVARGEHCGVSYFLSENYPSKLKALASNDSRVAKLLAKFPFLQIVEETYLPPVDTNAHVSLDEAGERAMRALLPHEAVLNGAEAYQQLRTKLTAFLAPFAKSHRVVTEDDIRGFFNELQNLMHS